MSLLQNEKIIIDCCLQDKDKVPLILDNLDPSDFDDVRLSNLFSTIQSLFAHNKPIDFFSVAQELRTIYKLDSSFITEFTGNYYKDGMDIDYYVKQVQDNGKKKRLQSTLKEVSIIANDEEKSFEDIRNSVSDELFGALSETGKHNEQNVTDAVLNLYKKRKQQRQEGKKLSGIPTGFEKLDSVINGWQPGTLTIIGGRSSHGKSTLAMDFFYRAVKEKFPSLYISLEQASEDIFFYLIQKNMGLLPRKIKSGNLSKIDEVNFFNSVSRLREYPLYFDDSTNTRSEIILKIKGSTISKNINLAFVDYIQLIVNPIKGESRHLEVAMISRTLKRLAMDLNISIIALSQLNKDCEGRVGKKIYLSDLRESEAIGHDADYVLFLNRPSLYGEDDTDYIQLAKNRHGERINKLPVKWDTEYNTYKEI